MAQKFGARLTLLHVYAVPGYVLPDGFMPAGPEVLARVEALTQESLSAWQADAQAMGAADVAVQSAVGLAAPEIVEAARGSEANLIVMATHGRSGWSHLLMGSVAEKVMRTAPCPVLAVPVRNES